MVNERIGSNCEVSSGLVKNIWGYAKDNVGITLDNGQSNPGWWDRLQMKSGLTEYK